MKITSCVPLAGRGVIARYGSLVAVTDSSGSAADPLLSALAEASAGGGGDFVLRAARSAPGRYGQSAWACAGVTADGGVAVVVHGRAVAMVGVDGAPETRLAASHPVVPVSRKFTGGTIAFALAIGDPGPADPQFWLGEGVVLGGGLAVTMTADLPQMAMMPPDGAAQPVMPVNPVLPVNPLVPAEPVTATVAPTALEIDAVAGIRGPRATVSSDDWRAQQPASTPDGMPAGGILSDDDPQAVLVDGVLCATGHFNDPRARACRQCGTGLDQPPRNRTRRQRPPLGVLVLDDGTRFPLDGDYVLGREPAFDSDVIEGRARPLRINDPNGTVSRMHLRISLIGWQVEVSDLGSANGSVLQSSGGERVLAPFEPTTIEPGARIGIGHRTIQYLAYQGVHQ